MSEGGEQPSGGETEHWAESEERFWKRARRRREVWKNLLWLVAGIALAILLNQFGCLTPT